MLLLWTLLIRWRCGFAIGGYLECYVIIILLITFERLSRYWASTIGWQQRVGQTWQLQLSMLCGGDTRSWFGWWQHRGHPTYPPLTNTPRPRTSLRLPRTPHTDSDWLLTVWSTQHERACFAARTRRLGSVGGFVITQHERACLAAGTHRLGLADGSIENIQYALHPRCFLHPLRTPHTDSAWSTIASRAYTLSSKNLVWSLPHPCSPRALPLSVSGTRHTDSVSVMTASRVSSPQERARLAAGTNRLGLVDDSTEGIKRACLRAGTHRLVLVNGSIEGVVEEHASWWDIYQILHTNSTVPCKNGGIPPFLRKWSFTRLSPWANVSSPTIHSMPMTSHSTMRPCSVILPSAFGQCDTPLPSSSFGQMRHGWISLLDKCASVNFTLRIIDPVRTLAIGKCAFAQFPAAPIITTLPSFRTNPPLLFSSLLMGACVFVDYARSVAFSVLCCSLWAHEACLGKRPLPSLFKSHPLSVIRTASRRAIVTVDLHTLHGWLRHLTVAGVTRKKEESLHGSHSHRRPEYNAWRLWHSYRRRGPEEERVQQWLSSTRTASTRAMVTVDLDTLHGWLRRLIAAGNTRKEKSQGANSLDMCHYHRRPGYVA